MPDRDPSQLERPLRGTHGGGCKARKQSLAARHQRAANYPVRALYAQAGQHRQQGLDAGGAATDRRDREWARAARTSPALHDFVPALTQQ
ncbi:hypothetical protein D3C72_1687980 [compost metagenome]